MDVRRNELVFLDTNAMIEAFRIHAWSALTGGFRMATVETCCVEAGRGNPNRPGYIAVDVEQVRTTSLIEQPTAVQLAGLDLRLGGECSLDAGERALLAHLVTRTDAWIVCSPDTACVIALQHLRLLDRSVSLEHLLDTVGIRANLRNNYTRRWLESLRTRLRIEAL
jgi:hypothetical protein